jgi:hypothetical protein
VHRWVHHWAQCTAAQRRSGWQTQPNYYS